MSWAQSGCAHSVDIIIESIASSRDLCNTLKAKAFLCSCVQQHSCVHRKLILVSFVFTVMKIRWILIPAEKQS